MNRIASFASYVPRYRLTREAAREAWPQLSMAVKSRSVPALDEDAITMAAHVALLALDRAGIDGADLSAIYLGTASSPYIVKSAAAVVADYVNARQSLCLVDTGSGAHAGLLALVNALRDRDLVERGPMLVIGTDAIFGPANDACDLGFGAAATAFVVGAEGFATLEAFDHSYSSYSNLWQTPGETHLQRYDDDRFDRSVGYAAQMAASLKRFVAELAEEPDWYALQLSGNGHGDRLLDAVGVASDRLVGRELVQSIGDTGCANALLNLSLALDSAAPGETVVVQAYGSGAGTATALIRVESADRPARAAADLPADSGVALTYVDYAKLRRLIPLTAIPSQGSPFAASPGWERTKACTVGLRGGRCTACGSLNFPERSYCLDCRGQEFDEVRLPRRAAVVTFNLQYVVAIGPEEAPLPICVALLEGEEAGRYGGKVAALVTDAAPDAIKVGSRVELVPRRGDVEDGMVKYGWKFRPLGAGD